MIHELKHYPEYRDANIAWLGEIPRHWEVRRTKHLLRERVQKGFPNEPLLAATQTKGVVRKEQYENRTVLALKDLHLLKLVEVDDFVISLRSFQGGIEYARERGIISPAYTILYPSRHDTHAYLAWLFKSKPYIESLSLHVTGIRQGQNVNYETLSRSPLPLPPEGERSAIVRFLDHAERRIRRYVRAKQKLIKLLEEQKQAVIHRAVTRGLDPNVRLKPSGVGWLGDVPEHWDVLPIKRCSTTISKGTTPSTEGRSLLEIGPIRFIKAENISISGVGIVDHPRAYIDDDTHHVLRRSQLHENDVLFVIAGATLGKTAIVRAQHLPANTNQAVAFIRPNRNVIPEFLTIWLQSSRIKEEIWLNAVQSAQPNLSMESLGNLPIPVPSVEEQAAILHRVKAELSNPNIIITHTEREIALLREYRTRLIADVVTGKLDVREAAAHLPDEAEDLEAADEAEIEADDDMADDVAAEEAEA